MSDSPIILAPASVPQEQLLASNSTITLYHGSAGGGKTYALILAMVKYAAMQNSTIICFRRTAPQIRSPGSVWQEASRMQPSPGAGRRRAATNRDSRQAGRGEQQGGGCQEPLELREESPRRAAAEA